MKIVHIGQDFSPTPGGRFVKDGPFSGQAFRKRFLEPSVDTGEEVVVELDEVAGLPSSFLEEAFGGLYRRRNAQPERIKQFVKVKTERAALQPYITLIERYMEEAAHRLAKA
jgi:hypothetical protein